MRLSIWVLYNNPEVAEKVRKYFSTDQFVFFTTFQSVVDALRLIHGKQILPPKYILTEACVAKSEMFKNRISIHGIILATTFSMIFDDTVFCVLNTDCETILEFPSFLSYRFMSGLIEGVHYCTQYQLIEEISIIESKQF
jgi:hypothetical protein